METINSFVTKFRNLSRTKKIILLLIVIIVIVFIVDLVMSYSKQNYQNIVNNPKKNSNIEKLNTKVNSKADEDESIIKVGNLSIHTQKLNVTLYFADWCGHCKQFISSTWGKVKEKYSNHSNIKLNEMDCTNIKTALTTPAGMAIKGFPTVIMNFKNAEGEYVEEEYNGSRAYPAFTEYMESLASGVEADDENDENEMVERYDANQEIEDVEENEDGEEIENLEDVEEDEDGEEIENLEDVEEDEQVEDAEQN